MVDDFCCGYADDEYCLTCGSITLIDPEEELSTRAWFRGAGRVKYEQDEDHRERQKAASKDWAQRNPDKALAKYKRRLALVRGATVSDLTSGQWADILRRFDHRCAYCGCRADETPQGYLTQDHSIPVSRGGDHTMDNVVPACQSCNSKKGQLTAEEFSLKV